MKNKNLLLLFLGAILLWSCSDDDDTPELIEEEEVITTVTVTLTHLEETITLNYKDLDGDGPEAPVVDVMGNLKANTLYTGGVSLLNESISPVEDITEEIQEKDEEHQFFYSFSGAIESVNIVDTDGNGDPLGLEFELQTTAAGDASFGLVLKHEPKKPNTGVLDAGGETDVEVNFTVTVE